MERRTFLKRLGVVIGGLALAEAVPLGRVYSFPTNIVIARVMPIGTTVNIRIPRRFILEKNQVPWRTIPVTLDRPMSMEEVEVIADRVSAETVRRITESGEIGSLYGFSFAD